MAIPASPEQRERWAEGPVNPANDPNRRIGPAGKLLMAGAILTSLVIPSDRQVDVPNIPNPEPLPELYCSDGAAQAEGGIDNLTHGGVERVWTEASDSSGSMLLSYDLQTGENLSQVAACFFVEVDEGVELIAQANNIEDKNVVKPGPLIIPINRRYMFQLTDDIDSIAKLALRSGYTADQIYAANGFAINVGVKDLWDPTIGETVALPLQRSARHTEKAGSGTSDTKESDSTEEPSVEDSQDTEQALRSRDEELKAFKSAWGEYAENIEKKYGIDKNVVLAQAIVESRYGTSELAKKANNLFGIKAHSTAEKTKNWDGKKYAKVTAENLTDEQLQSPEFSGYVITGSKKDGKTPVRVTQYFRHYASEQASFEGYGERVATFEAYTNAYSARTRPLDYIEAIAPIYATDPNYKEKIEAIYLDLKALDDPSAPEVKVEVNQTIAEKINNTVLTPEGFAEFKKSINRDYVEFAASKKAFQGGGLTQGKATQMFNLHFTALYYNGIGTNQTSRPLGEKTDVEHFITSIDNADGENCCGVQWLIGRDGTVYQLVEDPNLRLMHNTPYSEVSEGVEIESIDQKGITAKQYEAAGYLAAMRLLDKKLDIEKLKGHAEVRTKINAERAKIGKSQFAVRSDFPASESDLMRKKVKQLLARL